MVLNVFVFLLGFTQLPPLQRSDAIQFYADDLHHLLGEYVSLQESDPLKQDVQGKIIRDFEQLKKAIGRTHRNLIREFTGSTLDVEPQNDPVFGGRVILPPEKKENGHWSFTWKHVDVIPVHLWMYGLTFRGKRTLRIKQVIIHLRDGRQLDFDRWNDQKQGDGKEFIKERWLPFFWFSKEKDQRGPARLKSIDILGSAQDGDEPAKLDFLFRIPDPKPKDFPQSMAAIDGLIVKLKSKTGSEFLQDWRSFLDLLSREYPQLELKSPDKFPTTDPDHP